ncbi:flagellar hook-length control protein FliK [Vreelandella janggokensis]|uniref:flagellar hook-length control protein FliK n=1 Tax=Vreelandella janggokensis TaxID=370767 RepID=UPI002867789D|nr:flagellar hook-length control protein FliK [Halomonas janggokensis]MDR5887257.1 flagellar hook-length control protein FliK [Halomonas janggokensis]
MNIHQLLSTTQGQATSSQQGNATTADSARGFFQQALSQASASPHQRLASAQVTSPLNQAGNSPMDNGQPTEATSLSAWLESLGLDISPEALEALVARFASDGGESMPEEMTRLDASKSLDNATLDEIAQRLALMANFSNTASESQQLPGNEGAAPTATELAEQLGIEEGEAEQLVSLLSAFANSQGQTANTTDTRPSGASRGLSDIAQALGTSPQTADASKGSRAESLLSQVDARSASRQGPDTWVNALDTSGRAADGAAKANLVLPTTSSETLLNTLSSNNAAQSSGQASAQATSGQPTPTNSLGSAANPAPAAVNTPVTSPAWPQQLGQQLVQFAQRGGDQLVQMQLHPAELGALSISLKFGEQGAQAHFLSSHAQVRQVIEQAIPQLREALAEQGISLGETSVGEQRESSEQDFAQQQASPGGQPGTEGGEEGSGLAPTTLNAPITMDGRVDLYA